MKSNHQIKISGRAVIISFVILAVIAGIAAYVNHTSGSGGADKGSSTDGYHLTIAVSRGGDIKTVKTYTLQEIRKMDTEDVYAKLSSTNKEDIEGTFTGVRAETLLEDADKNILKKYSTFIFTAGDGYSSAASRKEIKNGDAVLVAFKRNGKAMEHFNDGGTGPMQVIFTRDTYGNRSTKYLTKIICK